MELPELAIGPITAKVDTGARTSALHAVDVNLFERDGSTWVAFAFEHEDGSVGTLNEAPVLEFRWLGGEVHGSVPERQKVTDVNPW